MTNQSGGDLYDLNNIHLITVGGLARVLPNQQTATVGQPLAGTVPTHQVIRPTQSTLCEEATQLGVTAQHAVQFVRKDCWHQRAFQHSVFGVKAQQFLSVSLVCVLVPLAVDAFTVG
jgi:hypothetical protein